MNKSAFRLLVLEALRVQPNNSFGGVEQRIKRSGLKEHIYDHLIVSEIIWELLVQGVLAPGNRIMGGIHTELPHFHVTEYGKQCLEAGDILPYDPEGYLDRLQQLVEQF